MQYLNEEPCKWMCQIKLINNNNNNSPNVTFSDVFRGYRNVTLGEYGLKANYR